MVVAVVVRRHRRVASTFSALRNESGKGLVGGPAGECTTKADLRGRAIFDQNGLKVKSLIFTSGVAVRSLSCHRLPIQITKLLHCNKCEHGISWNKNNLDLEATMYSLRAKCPKKYASSVMSCPFNDTDSQQHP